MSEAPLKVWHEKDGRVLRLRLDRPKANIIDAAMIAALSAAFEKHQGMPSLSAVLLDADGPHFSFGASVEEHMPDRCADMLASLHALIKQMLDFRVPVLTAIRGQCLGGGLEIACAGDLLFARADAQFAQPEIKLGVFAPAASCILPERIGLARASDLLWSGRSIDGAEAFRMGLVTMLDEEPSAAALNWIEEHLLGTSASSLSFAVKAARFGVVNRIKAKLDTVEALYLQELMSTGDAVEGLLAFVEKRKVNWEHR